MNPTDLRRYVSILVPLLAGLPAYAQRNDTRPLPTFEVVSIKAAVLPADAVAGMRTTGGGCGLPLVERAANRVTIPITTLCGLIRIAYNVADYQVVGVPPELAKFEPGQVFAVEARMATATTPSVDDTRPFFQTLLADRFQLRVHIESRQLPIYALVVARGGPKWARCEDPQAASVYTAGRIISCAPPMAMARVAQMLTRETGRPVVDRTGLPASYAFELHWLPDTATPQPDSPPSLFTAMQEQLGLRLEPDRAPVDTIIVDHAAAPTPN